MDCTDRTKFDFNTEPDISSDYHTGLTIAPGQSVCFILVTLVPSELYFIPTFFPPSRLHQQPGHLCGRRLETWHPLLTYRAPGELHHSHPDGCRVWGCRCLRSPYLCQCTTLLSTAVDPWPDTRQLPPPPTSYLHPCPTVNTSICFPWSIHQHTQALFRHTRASVALPWTDTHLYWRVTHKHACRQGWMSVSTPHLDDTKTLRYVIVNRYI